MHNSTSAALRVSLGPALHLNTPVLAAAGTFGYGQEVADFIDARSLGALITPTLTVTPRAGNAMPRTVEATAGLLHSLGMPNSGLTLFLADRLPHLRRLGCPVIVSIYADSALQWEELASGLTASEGVSALELNLSAVSHAGEGAILRNIEDAVRTVRRATGLPLIAKLPASNVEIGAAAVAAQESGADVIAVSQGFPGVAIRLSSRKFRLPDVSGDLSGPCIKPLALYQVWRVAQCVSCPIIGSGGIMTGDDALEFLFAGASAVAAGVANIVHPDAIASITADIAAYLEEHRLQNCTSLVGAALHRP